MGSASAASAPGRAVVWDRVGDVMGEQLAEESEENVDGRGLRPTGGGASGVGAAEGGATSAKRATNMNMQIW